MAEDSRRSIIVSCIHDRAPQLMPALQAEIDRRGLAANVDLVDAGCRGLCSVGPVVLIQPENIFYASVGVEDIPELVDKTLVGAGIVERLSYHPPESHEAVCFYRDTPFYSKQLRHVMRDCGIIDPWSIDDYIAAGGYRALGTVLTRMTPEEVIGEVKKSGLRGRGGAGFSTGSKWEHTRHADGEPKYVIANGDEGDPGAFMDRSIMEGNPHAVIEGMIVGAWAVGAHRGYAYIRDEYPLAVKVMRKMVEDHARRKRSLGLDPVLVFEPF